jgi:predicted Zn-dependent protease
MHRRRYFWTIGVTLTLAAGVLSAGSWYARLHYWLPKKHLEAAEQALADRDFSAARQELESYLEARPTDPRGHFLMARTCRRAGDLKTAEEHLARCENLQRDRPDPHLGDLKLEWALLGVQRGKLLEMEPLLRHRIKNNDPDTVLILETMSWELIRRNRLQEALALVQLWLEKQPEEAEALIRLGWLGEHLFDFNQASEAYRKALELKPDRESVRLRLAEVLVQQNQPAEAWEHLERLPQPRPADPQVEVCRARCLRLLQRTPQAKEVLDRLLAEKPQQVEALAARAQLALEEDGTQEAVALLEKAAAAEPLNLQVNFALVQCLTRLGKTREAQQAKSRLEQAETESKRMGELIRTVAQNPYDPALRYEVGMIFLRHGMARDGLHWLGTALDADPRHRPTHEALAQYYDRSGDKERAAYHRQFLN